MKSLNLNVNTVADYICWKFISAGDNINVAKLHKLLYFVQAWHMVNTNKSLFEEDFEAWSHGPVCKSIYDRYERKTPTTIPLQKKNLDLKALEALPDDVKNHIDNVLKDYGELSFLKLEEVIHEHDLAFKKAREGLTPTKQSNNKISKEDIYEFFKNQYTQK
jgi:uncharacterized phage-associated protein